VLPKRGSAWLARNRSRPVDFPRNVDTTSVPAFVRSSLISGCWTGARTLVSYRCTTTTIRCRSSCGEAL